MPYYSSVSPPVKWNKWYLPHRVLIRTKWDCACKGLNNSLRMLQVIDEQSSVQSLSRVRLFATHGLQHARPPCPSPTPRVYSNSCPLSRWCHPTISTSVISFFPPQVWGNWYSKRFTNQHYGTELLKTRARISSSLYIWFQILFCPPRSGQRLEKVFE